MSHTTFVLIVIILALVASLGVIGYAVVDNEGKHTFVSTPLNEATAQEEQNGFKFKYDCNRGLFSIGEKANCERLERIIELLEFQYMSTEQKMELAEKLLNEAEEKQELLEELLNEQHLREN